MEQTSLQIKIGVSGAAETGHCGIDAYDKGIALGREIAEQGGVIVTGATTGFPMWSAMGAKQAGGFSVGFSPASSEREHVDMYNLPLENVDLLIYTGFGYPGRDLIFTRSVDAMLFGCGRVGTIHEFTIAFEDQKPIGVLEGSWATDEIIKEILANGHRTNEHIIFDSDPKALVARIMEMVKKDKIANAAYHAAVEQKQ